MIVADAVVFWQFRQMLAPSRRLSNADHASLALVRVHLDVDTFRENVAVLESSHDTTQFSTEATEWQKTFLLDVEDAQQALSRAPEIAREDPTIPAALETQGGPSLSTRHGDSAFWRRRLDCSSAPPEATNSGPD